MVRYIKKGYVMGKSDNEVGPPKKFISDGNIRVCLNNIVAYETCVIVLPPMDYVIKVLLDNGSEKTLSFNKKFLQSEAAEWIDTALCVETLESTPCSKCINDQSVDKGDSKWCTFCGRSTIFRRFVHIKS